MPESFQFEGTPRTVVVIPAYNNASTVSSVIAGTARHVPDIIVVNDGSTDNTKSLIDSIASENTAIRVIDFDNNRGKGCALRAAFKKAAALGFTHAITVDADGQHYPSDIPVFLEKIALEPATLWIGNRVLRKEETGEPARSAAGRKFGSFWYKFITGIDIRDTQCGFRAYPLASVTGFGCAGSRYEFEQEVLVKAAWNGLRVASVDVHLSYAPKSRVVSHFRPVRDFLRIFAVNSKAVMIKLFLPFLIVDMPCATWRQKIVALFKYELHAHSTPERAAFSLTLGVFVGLLPIPFFQVLALLVLSFVMRINRPLAFLGVSISSAPMLPFIYAAAIAIGRLVVPVSWTESVARLNWGGFFTWGIEWFFGSIILALAAAGACWTVSYPVFKGLRRGKK